MAKKQTRRSLSLNRSIYEALKSHTDETGYSMSETVERLLEEHIPEVRAAVEKIDEEMAKKREERLETLRARRSVVQQTREYMPEQRARDRAMGDAIAATYQPKLEPVCSANCYGKCLEPKSHVARPEPIRQRPRATPMPTARPLSDDDRERRAMENPCRRPGCRRPGLHERHD